MRLFQALRKEKYKPWDPVFDCRKPAEHGVERQICGKLRSQRNAGGMLHKCAGLQGEKSHAYAPGLWVDEDGFKRASGPVTNQGFWPPQSIKIDQRPDKKFRQGFMGTPAAQRGWKQVTGFVCSLPDEGEQFLLQGESRGGSKDRAGGVTEVVWPSLGGTECRGQCTVPCFHSCPQLFTSGTWVLGLCILLSIICPNCSCKQLFLIPDSSFVFCCWRRRLSRCEHCSKGSQVPGPSLAQTQS